PNWRPEGVIDTRGDDGWSPEDGDGPAHITVTFDKPVDTNANSFMTIQLNFGHVDNTVAARFEFLAMTGTDDGSDLPPEIIDIIEKGPPQLAPPPGATGSARALSNLNNDDRHQLATYFADHSDFSKRDRIALANLEERLNVLTKKFPTMVMDTS